MLRKKFVPPRTAVTSQLRRPLLEPLPASDLVNIGLEVHLALFCLDRGYGVVYHFGVLARHLVLAQLLADIGCQPVPARALSRAEAALTRWHQHYERTGEIEIDLAAFEALQCFLLYHEEQLRHASADAVHAAHLKLQAVGQSKKSDSAVPYRAAA